MLNLNCRTLLVASLDINEFFYKAYSAHESDCFRISLSHLFASRRCRYLHHDRVELPLRLNEFEKQSWLFTEENKVNVRNSVVPIPPNYDSPVCNKQPLLYPRDVVDRASKESNFLRDSKRIHVCMSVTLKNNIHVRNCVFFAAWTGSYHVRNLLPWLTLPWPHSYSVAAASSCVVLEPSCCLLLPGTLCGGPFLARIAPSLAMASS